MRVGFPQVMRRLSLDEGEQILVDLVLDFDKAHAGCVTVLFADAMGLTQMRRQFWITSVAAWI